MTTSASYESGQERLATKGSGAAPLDGILASGETVIWAGRPDPFRIMRSKAAFALFGTVMIILLTMSPLRDLALPASQTASSLLDHVRRLIVDAVLSIAVIGLLVPLRAYWIAGRTWYALTDCRVLQVVGGRLEGSAALDHIETIYHRILEDDGLGDVVFSRAPGHTGVTFLPCPRGFLGIAHAEDIHRSIVKAQEELAKGRDCVVHDYLEFLLQGRRPDGTPR